MDIFRWNNWKRLTCWFLYYKQHESHIRVCNGEFLVNVCGENDYYESAIYPTLSGAKRYARKRIKALYPDDKLTCLKERIFRDGLMDL